MDEFSIRFQEAHGARLFRQGNPRALLEVKSPDIPPEVYEARLRGYDRAKATAARARLGTPKLMQGWQSGHTVTAGSFFCV